MTEQTSLIVVGVDDTAASRAALDFALQEGLARAATVEVVSAWVLSSPFEGLDHATTFEEGRDAAVATQDRVVAAAIEGLATRPVISQEVVHDYAGKALVEHSDSAAMIVVGSGRKGAVTRALLGSVSEYVVRHAACPVVVVPDPDRVVHHDPAGLETSSAGS